MPCDCSHLEASSLEREISEVACLLDELDGKPVESSHRRGYHPRVYNKVTRELGDSLTAELCSRLKTTDVTRYSLEMQMWWRDHQAADRKKDAAQAKTRKKPEDDEVYWCRICGGEAPFGEAYCDECQAED